MADLRSLDRVEVAIWFADDRWHVFCGVAQVSSWAHSREAALKELLRELDVEEKDLDQYGPSKSSWTAPQSAERVTVNRKKSKRWSR